jgi:hypothetical protein
MVIQFHIFNNTQKLFNTWLWCIKNLMGKTQPWTTIIYMYCNILDIFLIFHDLFITKIYFIIKNLVIKIIKSLLFINPSSTLFCLSTFCNALCIYILWHLNMIFFLKAQILSFIFSFSLFKLRCFKCHLICNVLKPKCVYWWINVNATSCSIHSGCVFIISKSALFNSKLQLNIFLFFWTFFWFQKFYSFHYLHYKSRHLQH